MALDGVVIRALCEELTQTLQGGRVEKIYQPLPRDLIMQVRNRGKSYKLLLSANPSFPRVLLADRYEVQNPPIPPMFCMLLRKHVEGGLIRRVSQISNERILHIVFEGTDELGERVERTLVVEIMGRHSNIILLDPVNRAIVDSIVHVSHATSRYREVLPGRTYITPPAQEGKQNPFEWKQEVYELTRKNDLQIPFSKFLVQNVLGISPVLAREIAYQSEQNYPATTLCLRDHADLTTDMDLDQVLESEWSTLQSYVSRWQDHSYTPSVRIDPQTDRPLGFSIVDLEHIPGTSTRFDSISTCMEWFYAEKVRYDVIQQKAGDLLRMLKTERDRNTTKIDKLHQDMESAKDAEELRLKGELITASIHAIKRGDSSLSTVNYYDEQLPTIEIELDPQLTPSENAQAYFRRYNKMKQSIPHIEQQLELTRQEIRYLDEVMVQIEQASYTELEEIREELEQEGYIKKERTTRKGGREKGKSNKKPQVVLERYRSPEGVEIIVGKNNKQNDHLSIKLASNSDTWLHTKDIPGSHVVIRAKEFSEQTLLLAAQLAAYYSKGRDSNQVPVDYTLVKHIWKPNGAKPGMILYEKQHTVYVKPALEDLQRL